MRTFLVLAALAVSSQAFAARAVQRQDPGKPAQLDAGKPAGKKPGAGKLSHVEACRKKFGSSYDARTNHYVMRGAKRPCRL